MKKLLKPEIEFIKFDTQDVITTSGGSDTPVSGGQINLNDKSETIPGENSPANQKDWGEPTFNF